MIVELARRENLTVRQLIGRLGVDHEDYVQILTGIATVLGPALGWLPAV